MRINERERKSEGNRDFETERESLIERKSKIEREHWPGCVREYASVGAHMCTN